jgi:hypothetical protein
MDEFDLGEWLHETVESSPDPATVELAKQLTSMEVRVLNYVEQVFWETGLCPTPERVAEDLSTRREFVSKAYANETFRTQLAARGIDTEGLVTVGKLIQESRALSAKQIICANLMLNLHDKRSEREKLAYIQVSSQQYHAWLRQPAFVEFLRKRGEALFSSSDFHAYKSLINNVKAGDNKSLELFFRMRGIYRPELNININIESVLVQVIETISRHVKDPAVINAIANELDNIIDAEEVA